MKTKNKTEKERLTFEEFMDVFRKKLFEYFPEITSAFDLEEEIVLKNSTELHGIIVRREGKNIAPVFYYEVFYQAYLHGTSIEESVLHMMEYLLEEEFPGEDFGQKISKWEEIKSSLILKLVNATRNRKMLSNMPNRQFGDMAVVVQVLVNSEKFGSGTVHVDNDLMKVWNISEKTVFDQAFENMRKLDLDIQDLMGFASPEKEFPEDCPKIYVLRYDSEIFGAPAIMDVEKLRKFAEKTESDYFVMPVSVHEALLVEYKDDISNEFLFGMLESINHDHPDREEVLSYEVFKLNRCEPYLTYISNGQSVSIPA